MANPDFTMMNNTGGVVAPVTNPPTWWENFSTGVGDAFSGIGDAFGDINWLDRTDTLTGMKTQGALMPALGAANGLFQGWMGMKQLGLANKQLKENKRQFDMNWGAQRQAVNNALHNAEISRRGSSVATPEYMAGYMDKWGIK